MNGKMVGVVLMGMAVMAPGVLAEQAAREQTAGAVAAATTTPAQAAPSSSQTSATAATPAPSAAAEPVTPPSASEAAAEPSVQQVSQAIHDYISQIEEDEGSFTLEDEVTGKTRTLTLERVQEQVGKTSDGLSSVCTDMRDKDSGEALDVDFDVEAYDGELEVVDTRIHKVNGQVRASTTASSTSAPVTQ